MRLIDADELLKSGFFSNETIPERILFVGDVESMPTIDPIKHGKWNRLKDHVYFDGDSFECSVCGEQFFMILEGSKNYNYCSNCGAKMDGVTN